jgi:mono/diheme cytochrome c family protein
MHSRAGCGRRAYVVAWLLALAPSLGSAQDSAAPVGPTGELRKLWATHCSWCHDGYGMHGGKGPRLAGTSLSEQKVADRIRDGKSGAMPGFGKSLTPDQIAAFASYIKGLKAED